ncbi:glycoside hydrolase family 32 protein [Streptococcus gallolyticus]|nr:glycoside hydrolase family 32 protein [Streptococcus gallolyticus]MBY5041751.1 glycoside hydrolase family 32 protein [Streptococcus gallolyticus]
MTEREFTVAAANQFIKEHAADVDTTFRPQVHFTAPVGWINDPNGMVYFQDAYHLFYQYYPYDSCWGPMHWGHARSTDLVHWEHLPVALASDMPYDNNGCFSGSAIVKGDKLWLMYTGNIVDENGENRQIQNMAYSTDGIHFEKLACNPVLTGADLPEGFNKPDFRDPKLFEKDGRYYSVIVSQHVDQVGAVLLFVSDDLEKWEFASVFLKGLPEQGFMWECPDYFQIDGQDLLVVSPMRFKRTEHDYANINSSVIFSGKVDWERLEFVAEDVKEIDHGQDFYAPQTLEDKDGRRIMIAWQQMWGRNIPTHELKHAWAGSMTFPRELRLRDGLLQQVFPLEKAELKLLQSAEAEQVSLEQVLSGPIHLLLEGVVEKGSLIIGSEQDKLILSYQDGILALDRTGLALAIKGEEEVSVEKRTLALSSLYKLEVIVDGHALDVLVNDGRESLSTTFYIEGERRLHLDLQGQDRVLASLSEIL